METKQILQTLDSLNHRITVIEQALSIKSEKTKTQAAEPVQQKSQPAQKTTTADQQNTVRSWNTEKQTTVASTGGSWMGTVAVFFFILAAGLFVKLAIDSGWLTPVRQLAAIVVFAGSLIFSGFRLRGSDARYAGFLPAAGIAILFLAGYAGHLFYGIYDTNVAILTVAAIGFFSIYLFTQFRHDFFLIAAIIGTYLVPIFVSPSYTFTEQQSVYYLFWNVLYCYLAILLKKRLLIVLAAYLGLGVYQVTNTLGISGNNDHLLWGIGMQALQFLIFMSANAYYSVRNQQALSALEAWAFFPVLMLFYTIEYALLNSLVPEITPYLALGFAALVFVVYHFTKQRMAADALASSPMLSAFICLVIGHVTYIELLPDGWGGWYAVALLGLISVSDKAGLSFKRFWISYLIIYAVIGLEYLNLLETAPLARQSEYLILNIIFFGALFGSYFAGKTASPSLLLLVAGYVQALVGLNRLAQLILTDDNQRYLTSTFWAIFALLNLIYAARVKDQLIARLAVFIFGIVAFKVLFIDVSGYGGIGRIIALILVGALLYAGGLILRKINSWNVNGTH